MKVFFDTEFTGLRKDTSLISIGCVAEGGAVFYAELTDYPLCQVDDWVRENVIDHLLYQGHPTNERGEVLTGATTVIVGDKTVVAPRLREWLESQSAKNAVYGDMRNIYPDRAPQKIEMWSDCLAYDWVLFCDLFGGAFGIPECVYYIPFDLSTLFKMKGIDPDVHREEFAGIDIEGRKHNALHDAKVIKACYEKAMGGEAA